ncbi:MAG: hypothetical protein ACI4D8_07220 [Wujia sp.]
MDNNNLENNSNDDTRTVLVTPDFQQSYAQPQPVPQPIPQQSYEQSVPQPMPQQSYEQSVPQPMPQPMPQQSYEQPVPQPQPIPQQPYGQPISQQPNMINRNLPFSGDSESFVANIQQEMPVVQTPVVNQPKKKKTGLIIAIIAVILLAGAGVGGYFMFFTPEKRLERSLDKGQEALESEEYQEAYDAYKKALKLDKDNIDAWSGMLEAGLAIGDASQFKEDFDEAVKQLEEMDSDLLKENQEKVVRIYLMVDDAHPDDVNTRISILEKGYELTGKSSEISGVLVETYFIIAESYANEDDLEMQVETYNTILTYESDNAQAIDDRKNAVDTKISELVTSELYDDAETLINKYKEIVTGVDYDYYLTQIESARRIIDAKHRLMETTLEYMSAGDYDSMREVDGSEDASIVCTDIDSCYIYSENGDTGNFTGTGAGIFKYGDGSYYFYYGDFVEGVPSGNGTLFIETDPSFGTYELYTGEWSDGKPNGFGRHETRYVEYGDSYVDKCVEGNFVNGLDDGTMTGTLVSGGVVFSSTWIASMGKVSVDVRADYPEYDIDEPDTRIVYAVLLSPDSSTYWWYTCGTATVFGVPGFN